MAAPFLVDFGEVQSPLQISLTESLDAYFRHPDTGNYLWDRAHLTKNGRVYLSIAVPEPSGTHAAWHPLEAHVHAPPR